MGDSPGAAARDAARRADAGQGRASDPDRCGLSYEPKWDGFRCIVFRDGDEVELASRNEQAADPLLPRGGRAPLRAAARRAASSTARSCVRRRRRRGSTSRLLQQRIHPAASPGEACWPRQTPADFVAFDLLALGDERPDRRPFASGGRALEEALAGARPPVHLTPATTDPDERASGWFEQFEGAGLDGVIAKPLARAVPAGQAAHVQDQARAHRRLRGRRATAGTRPARWSARCCSASTTTTATLHHVGVSASLHRAPGASELLDELAPYRDDALDGPSVVDWPSGDRRPRRRRSACPAGSAGGTRTRTCRWEPLRPELVVEVGYDAHGGRPVPAHRPVQVRWRPDRDARSCTYDQLERPIRFDVDQVLRGQPVRRTRRGRTPA